MIHTSNIDPVRARSTKPVVVARTLAAAGFRLMQTPPHSKHPWRERYYDSATSDPRLIEVWDGHWPAMNYSVLCGRAGGVFVLDADGQRGLADLARLESAHGRLETWRVRTGRDGGGEHVYLRLPAGDGDVRNQQPLAGTKVDVRGFHGHVLIPSSLHKSGRRYEWLTGCAPGEIELATCPPGWWDFLPKREAATASRKHTPSARRTRGVAQRQHDPASTIIGDGEGAGGFNRPIRSKCCAWFARFGVDSDSTRFKEVLRTTILNADASGHTPEQIERYASDSYLDAEIASAREFIRKEKA